MRQALAHPQRFTLHRSPRALRVGDPVKLKESRLDLRGDVWELCTGRYVVVRWRDECCTTHSENALEYDPSRSRADWARHLAHEDR